MIRTSATMTNRTSSNKDDWGRHTVHSSCPVSKDVGLKVPIRRSSSNTSCCSSAFSACTDNCELPIDRFQSVFEDSDRTAKRSNKTKQGSPLCGKEAKTPVAARIRQNCRNLFNVEEAKKKTKKQKDTCLLYPTRTTSDPSDGVSSSSCTKSKKSTTSINKLQGTIKSLLERKSKPCPKEVTVSPHSSLDVPPATSSNDVHHHHHHHQNRRVSSEDFSIDEDVILCHEESMACSSVTLSSCFNLSTSRGTLFNNNHKNNQSTSRPLSSHPSTSTTGRRNLHHSGIDRLLSVESLDCDMEDGSPILTNDESPSENHHRRCRQEKQQTIQKPEEPTLSPTPSTFDRRLEIEMEHIDICSTAMTTTHDDNEDQVLSTTREDIKLDENPNGECNDRHNNEEEKGVLVMCKPPIVKRHLSLDTGTLAVCSSSDIPMKMPTRRGSQHTVHDNSSLTEDENSSYCFDPTSGQQSPTIKSPTMKFSRWLGGSSSTGSTSRNSTNTFMNRVKGSVPKVILPNSTLSRNQLPVQQLPGPLRKISIDLPLGLGPKRNISAGSKQSVGLAVNVDVLGNETTKAPIL